MVTEPFTILLVDGNKVSLKLYSKILKAQFDQACRIVEVSCGADAVYYCTRQQIGCIVTDFQLPDMNCLSVIRQLRDHQNAGAVPVVVLTSKGDEKTAVDVMRAGAQDYLVKGNFAPEILGGVITKAMENANLHNELAIRQRDLDHANQVLSREVVVRKQVEDKLRLFRDLMNQTVDILFVAEPKSTALLDFNDAICSSLGYDRDELLTMNMAHFDSHLKEATAREEIVAKLMEGGSLTYESSFSRMGGSTFPVEVTLKYISRTKKNYMVGVARDSTERKKTEAKLLDISNRDGLTGLYNRRYMDDQLNQEWARLGQEGKPISLVMLDVDFFKTYNDHYGHRGGDDCLKTVSHELTLLVNRPGDIIARYGGEEFVVILPATDSAEASYLAEILRMGIESLKLAHKKSEIADHLTLSVGVATLIPGAGLTPKMLIEHADNALYRAKQLGRNRVEVSGEKLGDF